MIRRSIKPSPAQRRTRTSTASPLRTFLAQRTAPGELGETMAERPGWIRCFACGHRCRIPPERDGICKVRFNRGGTLMVPATSGLLLLMVTAQKRKHRLLLGKLFTND